MIDVHTHVLPKIDDGSKSIEETLQMIDEAYTAGFTDIITTSHYIDGHYDINSNDRAQIINGLQNIINSRVTLHNGAEAYITPELVDLYNEGIIPTLAGSRYALFELPMNSEVMYAKQVVNDLLNSGYIPIIAHPERYSFVQRNIKKAYEFADMGALLQCNYGSFIGRYGREAEKVAIKLLKEDKITFLGTDTHRANSIYTKVPEVVEKIHKLTNSDKIYQLTVDNPSKILDNDYI